MLTGMSVSCLFTKTSGFPGLLATFILTDGWMDGWSVHFFFGPYLENYYIIFFNCFSSLKYMDLHIFWNIRRKKIGIFFFSKYFAKIITYFFFEKFFKDFSISRKLLDIFSSLFLVPLEEWLRHLLKKKLKKNRILILSKNFASFFFSMKFGRFLKGLLL